MTSRFARSALAMTLGALFSCAGEPPTAPAPSPPSFLKASTITVSVASIEANGSSTAEVTVALRDSLGVPAGRSEGVVAISPSTGTVSPVVDHGNGTYTATYLAPRIAGLAYFTATLNGQIMAATASIDLLAGVVDAAHSVLTVSDTMIFANNVATATVFVETRDVNDNSTAVGVGQVTVATTSGIIGQVTGGVGGHYVTNLKSPTKGTAVISAQIDGRLLPSSVQVRFVGGFWVTEASLPNPRQVLAVGTYNGVLYAVGGGGWSPESYSGATEAYNPATNDWTSKSPMPTSRGELAGGVIDGVFYAVGGYNGTDLRTLEAYDIATDAWSTKAPMPTGREGLAVGVVNGILYAIGGNVRSAVSSDRSILVSRSARIPSGLLFDIQSAEHVLATVEAYDPATNTWTTRTPMPTPRSQLAVGVINGIIYAVGGQSLGGGSRVVESYDPATNSWATVNSLPERYGRPAVAVGVLDGLLYAVGGFAVYQETNIVDVYNPSTNRWTVGQPMPTMRQSLGIGVIDGVLYAVGGACYDDTFAIVEALIAP